MTHPTKQPAPRGPSLLTADAARKASDDANSIAHSVQAALAQVKERAAQGAYECLVVVPGDNYSEESQAEELARRLDGLGYDASVETRHNSDLGKRAQHVIIQWGRLGEHFSATRRGTYPRG